MSNIVPSVPMSRFERAVAAVSPGYALKRYGQRVQLEAASRFFTGTGGYNAARHDRPATKEWRPPHGDADQAGSPDLPELRARSQDLARNEPLAVGALATHCTSVVGVGLVPHPRIDREFLRLSDEQAEQLERQIERLWWAWAGTDACDISRRDNFAGLTYLALRSWLVGGDVFAVRRFKERDGDFLALKLQLIEAERVCNPNFRQNTDRLIDGVEVDEDGAAVAYHVADTHPTTSFGTIGAAEWKKVEAFGKDSGIRQVLQVYRRTRPGQTRGVPLFAPIIESLKQLGRYSEAELMAAVINAFFTVFIKTAAGEGADMLQDMGDPNTKATPAAGAVGDVRLGAGAIVGLQNGESIEVADPKRPNPAFEQFQRAFYSQIGVAVELPHELLIKHFTSSYSASRAALLEAWRGFHTRREWMVDLFCQPVYGWVLGEAAARGLINLPGFFDDPLTRAAWSEAQWTGPTQGQIDPLNEMEAAMKRIQMRVDTRQNICTELRGTDWDQTFRQLAKERRMMEGAGLDSEDVSER
ncbi:MAG: phage portal protein, partial [Gemmatimonadaceae bacterium]